MLDSIVEMGNFLGDANWVLQVILFYINILNNGTKVTYNSMKDSTSKTLNQLFSRNLLLSKKRKKGRKEGRKLKELSYK